MSTQEAVPEAEIQTITYEGVEYPITFETTDNGNTRARVGTAPFTQVFIKYAASNGQYPDWYVIGGVKELRADETSGGGDRYSDPVKTTKALTEILDAVMANRPKPTVEERLDAIESLLAKRGLGEQFYSRYSGR